MANEESGDDSNNGLWGTVATAVLGGLLGSYGQKQTNEANVQLGREQMAFQERMSGTAYQRAVKDMAAAGINPMLVTQVGGATSPSGSMPQVQNALGTGVSSAQQAMATMREPSQVEQSQAATKQMVASTDKIRSETLDKSIHTARALAETDRTQREAMLKAMQEMSEAQRENILRAEREEKQTKLGENLLAGKYKADAERDVAESELTKNQIKRSEAESKFWDSEIGKSMPYLRGIIEILRGSASTARTIAGH